MGNNHNDYGSKPLDKEQMLGINLSLESILNANAGSVKPVYCVDLT